MEKLYLQINEAGYITGWASMGKIENGIEVDPALERLLDASIMGCQKYESGRIVTDKELLAAKDKAVETSAEIIEIKSWFDWYDNQISQYQRAVRRGEEFDQDIAVLDAMAALKQKRLRELLSEATE